MDKKLDGLIEPSPQRKGRNRRSEFQDTSYPGPGDNHPRHILRHVPVIKSVEHSDSRDAAEMQRAQVDDDVLVRPRKPGQLRAEPIGIEGINFAERAENHDALVPRDYQSQARGGRWQRVVARSRCTNTE